MGIGIQPKLKKNLFVREDGDTNQYIILSDKQWIVHITMNGEFTLEKQRQILNDVEKALNNHFAKTPIL